MTATIAQLTDELVTLVKTSPSIGTNGFSVFNIEDLVDRVDAVGFPLAGIAYEGCYKQENSVVGQKLTKSAVFNTLYFTIVIGVNYLYATSTDTKPTATNLLDEVRKIVLGYTGVNNRPWVFSGETPIETDIEGAIFYGQTWETSLPILGNSFN